ncbi:sensor domain-containing diguanylate cyclase [Rugamonas apoptosis]|uniref:PAS domain S-box protein n=1 Tax=Rugamonas apoptosis TaxID=2758570 RepID=A0A7W2F905_9BURK|nr:PAS domain S-box protein [Rugamonas apoptosis]MBA5687340.1 PAS domain S-box protein [Rugamonas apoptosis]
MTAVVVALVLAATVIVTSVALLLAERDMEAVIGDQQFALLSAAAANIDSQLEAKRTLLASLADAVPPDLNDHPERMQQFIEQHPTVRAAFLNLVTYDRQGVLRHTARAGIGTWPLTAASKQFFEQALASRGSLISDPFKSTLTDLPVVLITQPVLDQTGAVAMVLAGSIDLANASFLTPVSAQRPGKTGFMYIMTSKGILVNHPTRARLLQHINARPGVNRATEMALQGFEGWTNATNKDGREGIYAYKRIPAADWILGARYPTEEAFAPMIVMRRHAVLVSTLFAALAGAVGWAAIHVLLRPLGRLRRHIADIRAGKAGIDVLQRRRRDEIGELSAAFHVLMAEREAAEQNTRESESLIRNILEQAPDAFISCDPNGIITEWNAQAEKSFGWSRAEAVGQDVAELIIPPAMRPEHRAGMARFAAGGNGPVLNSRVRVTARHRGGHEVPVELSVRSLRHGNAYYATAFLHDITERLVYEQQIAASEKRARMIADNMPAMIAYVDDRLRYRFTNEHCRQLLGIEPNALLGRTFGDTFGEAFRERLRPHYEAALRGERVHYEREGNETGRPLQLMVDLIPDQRGDGSVAGFYLMALDITERKTAELTQAASEQRLKLLTDNLPVLISYTDRERRIQFLNATYRDWFGIDPDSMIGRPLADGIGREQYRDAEEHLERAYQGQIVTYEQKARIKGSIHTLETTFVPEVRGDGEVAGVYTLTHDTTRMKEIEERLIHLARVDPLTGIPNRLMFEELLQLAIGRARRNRQPMALAYLDVDKFKNVNDSMGHGGGDAVLKEFALRLAGNVRATDTVARLAGDEFVIIFEQVNDPDEASRLAAKIVEAIRPSFTVAGQPLAVTTSVGVALHLGGEQTAAELVARADGALYAAKRRGRDGYVVAQ